MSAPRAVVITCSTRAATGVYEDRGGPLITQALRQWGFDTADPVVVPDGRRCSPPQEALAGTPPSCSPPAAPGSRPRTARPRPLLRCSTGRPGHRRGDPGGRCRCRCAERDAVPGVAGLAGRTLVVNLPGSTGGARRARGARARSGACRLAGGWRRPLMPAWPVTLHATTPAGEVLELGALRRRDRHEWRAVRAVNRGWLGSGRPPRRGQGPVVRFGSLVRHYNSEARAGRSLPFVIRSGGGWWARCTSSASPGGRCSRARRVLGGGVRCGRGIAPTALACAGDYAMGELGLHRIEVNIRPDNVASLAVVRKLGFRDEGLREQYLHINGPGETTGPSRSPARNWAGGPCWSVFTLTTVTSATHRRTSPGRLRRALTSSPCSPAV